MKHLFLVILSVISFYAYSDSAVIKTESNKFDSMKTCVAWIDSKFPNAEWHKDGQPWYLSEDTPELVFGDTELLDGKNNLKYPISFKCEKFSTGTMGIYFDGSYSALMPIKIR